jgi:hypothetical protein
MPMTGIYLVQGSGESHCQSENRRQTRRNLIGSVEELYNEIEKSIQADSKKENPFKGFEMEIWTKKTMI